MTCIKLQYCEQFNIKHEILKCDDASARTL